MAVQYALATELTEEGVEGAKYFEWPSEAAGSAIPVKTLVGAGLVAATIVTIIAMNGEGRPQTPQAADSAIGQMTASASNLTPTLDDFPNAGFAEPAAMPKVESRELAVAAPQQRKIMKRKEESLRPTDDAAITVDPNADTQLAMLRKLQSNM
jgi:hypothetical protein